MVSIKSLLYLSLDCLQALLSKHRLFQTLGISGERSVKRSAWFHGPTITLFRMLLGLRLARAAGLSAPSPHSPCSPGKHFWGTYVFSLNVWKLFEAMDRIQSPTRLHKKQPVPCAFHQGYRYHLSAQREAEQRASSSMQIKTHAGQMLHHPTTWTTWNSLPYLNV